jgi:serine/threonine protein kinase/WD40 repeat protein
MIRRFETDPIDRDERLGEAIEAYLALAEEGHAPNPEQFAAKYPDLREDLEAALDGLALVRGLVGAAAGSGGRLEAGRRIAGYRIVRELGRGGMGVVYEAVHVDLDRPVALKVLGGHAAPDSIGRRRFLNEARTAAGLHHTHIVPVFDVGQVGGLYYYAMQRIEGSGLDRVLRALRRDRSTAAGSSVGKMPSQPSAAGQELSGPVESVHGSLDETGTWIAGGPALAVPHRDDEPPPFIPPRGSAYYRWVADVGRQAAEALAYAHHRGVIHRDVKPSNLLVDARGAVWMADFGLARRLTDPNLTQSDSLLGTPRYMSPEQARQDVTDARTDIYSLGATLYELLTLRPPFEGRSAAELSKQIIGREPVAPRQFDPKIPRDLETIILKAMAKRPADRYGTARELADDLIRFLHYEPVRARRISPAGRLWRFACRHPSMTAVTTAAALAVLTSATVAYIQVARQRDEALAARAEAQKAQHLSEQANRETQTAMRKELLSEAKLTRSSTDPNRREHGLELLKRAAAMGPDPALRLKLRDEAVEFLALRDVQRRQPELATGPIRGMALSVGLGGLRLATVSENGEFRLWGIDDRGSRTEPTLAGPSGSGEGRRRGAPTAIAPMGHHLAVVWPNGHGVRFFDASTGRFVYDLELPGRIVASIAASPGEPRRLVIVERIRSDRPRDNEPDGFRVCLWDPTQPDCPIATLAASLPDDPELPLHFPPLVAIDPEGETVAVAWRVQSMVTLWSARDGKALEPPIDTQLELSALALGPDGVLAAAGTGTVRLWELETRTPSPSSLNPHLVHIRQLRFSADGTLLAVAGSGTGIELWDPASATLVAGLPTSERVNDLAFAPAGAPVTLAVSGEQGSAVALWSIASPEAVIQFSGFPSAPTALSFGPEGQLAMACRDGAVRLWTCDRCPTSSVTWEDCQAGSLVFDRQGRLVTLDGETLRWYRPPARDCERQIALPELPREWNLRRPGSQKPLMLTALASTADGRKLALARMTEVMVWSADQPSLLHSITPPKARSFRGRRGRGEGRAQPERHPPWRTLALSPRGDRLYLNHFNFQEENFFVWALDGTRARRLLWNDVPKSATALALSPDGATLALGTRTSGVVLVDTARGQVRATLPSPADDDEGPVTALAFSPSGDGLAAGTQHGSIYLWRLSHGESVPLVRLPSRRAVTTLTFDTPGHYLASGSEEKTVQVWLLDHIHNDLENLGLGW